MCVDMCDRSVNRVLRQYGRNHMQVYIHIVNVW